MILKTIASLDATSPVYRLYNFLFTFEFNKNIFFKNYKNLFKNNLLNKSFKKIIIKAGKTLSISDDAN